MLDSSPSQFVVNESGKLGVREHYQGTSMNPYFKKTWLKALRGGNIEQTRGHLLVVPEAATRNLPAGMCCLGVLRYIANPTDMSSRDVPSYEPNCLLSDEQLKTFGLEHETQRHLATMNDDGLSFKEIADWIEKNL